MVIMGLKSQIKFQNFLHLFHIKKLIINQRHRIKNTLLRNLDLYPRSINPWRSDCERNSISFLFVTRRRDPLSSNIALFLKAIPFSLCSPDLFHAFWFLHLFNFHLIIKCLSSWSNKLFFCVRFLRSYLNYLYSVYVLFM